MMDALESLAHYVREACEQETLTGLAKRLKLHKNYVFRAAHPNQEAPNGRIYSPPLTKNAVTLLAGLCLTVAPDKDSIPTVGHITAMIDKMEGSWSAKQVAKAAVQAVRLVG